MAEISNEENAKDPIQGSALLISANTHASLKYQSKIKKTLIYLKQLSANLRTSKKHIFKYMRQHKKSLQNSLDEHTQYFKDLLKKFISESHVKLSKTDHEFLQKSLFPISSRLFTPDGEEYDVKKLFNKEIYEDVPLNGSLDDEDYLIYADRKGNINKVNLDNHQLERFPYLNNFWRSGLQVSLLAPGVYFLHGGMSEAQAVSPSCFVMDLNAQTFIEKTSSKNGRCVGGCAFKDNKVYVFGGFSYETLAHTEVYDVLSDKWQDFAPLPKESYWNTASLVNNSVCVTGFGLSGVIKYDEILDQYSVLCEIEQFKPKLLLENWAFLRNCEYVWEIRENDIVKHPLDIKWTGYYLLTSRGFRRGKWIYFIEGFENEIKASYLRRFDIELRRVEYLENFGI